MSSISVVFIEYLVEIMLSLIVTFNVVAYKILWDRTDSIENQTEKNSESITMILNRIFGLDEDPTDEGHIMETHNEFEKIDNHLEKLRERQKEARKERQKEHEKVYDKLSSLVDELDKEDELSFDKREWES